MPGHLISDAHEWINDSCVSIGLTECSQNRANDFMTDSILSSPWRHRSCKVHQVIYVQSKEAVFVKAVSNTDVLENAFMYQLY